MLYPPGGFASAKMIYIPPAGALIEYPPTGLSAIWLPADGQQTFPPAGM